MKELLVILFLIKIKKVLKFMNDLINKIPDFLRKFLSISGILACLSVKKRVINFRPLRRQGRNINPPGECLAYLVSKATRAVCKQQFWVPEHQKCQNTYFFYRKVVYMKLYMKWPKMKKVLVYNVQDHKKFHKKVPYI